MKEKVPVPSPHATCVYSPGGVYAKSRHPESPTPADCRRACCRANHQAMAEAASDGRPRPPHRCIGPFAQKYYAVN